jgi:peptide deformylase
MPKLIQWNVSILHTKSHELTGPLNPLYLRDLTQMVETLSGVYLSGVQCGDIRRFAIPNPRFKDFPIIYNPQIINQYDLIKSEGEGCLSFPGLWLHVPRFKFIEVRYRDGSWQEKTVTFGAEDQNTEEALLCKAIQHEIAHMDGICLHERITVQKKRIKALAKIMQESIAQNKRSGIPQLIQGPDELDPSTIQHINDTKIDSVVQST